MLHAMLRAIISEMDKRCKLKFRASVVACTVQSIYGLTSNKLQQNFFYAHALEDGPLSNYKESPKICLVELPKKSDFKIDLLPQATQVGKNPSFK